MLRRQPIQLIRFVNGRAFHSHWQTIRLIDNAHGDHDLHRYTGSEKQPAERFAEGTVNEVAPMAIRYLIDHWEAIAEAWKN